VLAEAGNDARLTSQRGCCYGYIQIPHKPTKLGALLSSNKWPHTANKVSVLLDKHHHMPLLTRLFSALQAAGARAICRLSQGCSAPCRNSTARVFVEHPWLSTFAIEIWVTYCIQSVSGLC
jgi:hypothetical protein